MVDQPQSITAVLDLLRELALESAVDVLRVLVPDVPLACLRQMAEMIDRLAPLVCEWEIPTDDAN
jgi:hypothetical protein